MSAQRWAISLLLCLHFGAMALGSVPSPGAVQVSEPPSSLGYVDAIAVHLRPILDNIVDIVVRFSSIAWQETRPLPQISSLYLHALGLGQQWVMFRNPPQQDEYARVRYYVVKTNGASPDEPAWVATELVYPLAPEDRPRLIRSFWYTGRDVAIFSALRQFLDVARVKEEASSAQDVPDNLAPVARHFARAFQRNYLTSDERLIRTDVWFGEAPTPPRGSSLPVFEREDHLEALRNYYQGMVEDHMPPRNFPPRLAIEREADITWTLLYFE
jgi:hypothetical protein